MKTKFLCIIFILSLGILPVFADTIELHPDDVGATTSIRTTKSRVVIPVSAEIVNSELDLYFTTSVGLATVSVTDEDGNVQYLEVLDTDSESDFAIDLSSLTPGTYTLNVVYGSQTIVGDFDIF